MRFNLQSWPVSTLLTNFHLLTVPPFQRENKIWNQKTKELLIDSILRGWKIPKIYLNIPDNQMRYEIVDGQQRIFTIIDFLQNHFKIKINESDKKNFKDLNDEQQESILTRKIDVEIISEASDEEVALLYSRLQEGASLNPAEKIHAVTGKLSEFIEQMEIHQFFSKTNFRKKRFGIKGVCQQIFYLRDNGIGTAKYPKMKDFFEENRSLEDKELNNQIISTLNFMNQIFLEEQEYLSKAGNVISIFLICSWLQNSGSNILPGRLYRFFNRFFGEFNEKNKIEVDYINYNLYLIQSTSGEESIKKRNEILRRHLCLEEPALIRYIDTPEILEFKNNMEISFGNKVEIIQKLIKEINERAIGNGRSIIFDFTTESSYVFTALSRLITDANSYDRVIDLLWKSFYEGSQSGNKIGSLLEDRNHRKPIKDINILIKIDDLRKISAHDLEHDRTTYEPKIRIACEIRELWTGKKFVQDFDDYDFIVFQYRLILELLEFVIQLNESFK